MNLEILHQVLFLDQTWEFANGSNIKMSSDYTSHSTRKTKLATNTKYITVHNGTQTRFLSGTNLMFLSGNKLADLSLLLWGIDPLLGNDHKTNNETAATARKQPARQWTGSKALFSTWSAARGYKLDKV